jgi:hypothetical protein
MKSILFSIWLVGSAVVLAVFAQSAFPHTAAWMFGLVAWAVVVVPLSFQRWFAARRRHEESDTELALRSWSKREANAGVLLAVAVDEALEEQDERSLQRLLGALEGPPGDALRPERDAFLAAARTWLADEGGRSSREAHLEAAREQARSLTARLRTA